ncbi:hypothetical protein [Hoeflea sp.]|uniref:hypothetical protein n=1 Tax=Hoeflea sp. TaxID=1940281 RepID=UPI003B014791
MTKPARSEPARSEPVREETAIGEPCVEAAPIDGPCLDDAAEIQSLNEAGLAGTQAEALALCIRAAVATKSDVALMRSDIERIDDTLRSEIDLLRFTMHKDEEARIAETQRIAAAAKDAARKAMSVLTVRIIAGVAILNTLLIAALVVLTAI